MFIVSLNYIKPLAEIEAYLPAHIEYLNRHYAAGHFLFSGRKEPRTGGVIIMRAGSRAQVEAMIAEDPFYQAKLAEYQITQFIPTKTADDLIAYRETL
ncbi:GTP cyclohydrolase [Eikenella longinqua]|uniref:GTP cyclohydrolase n=1 Tax=Eikenella longinqua TaxID=1795827 RepID=A0A1A9RXH1_9NEIS|nr:YciI family protein [Eikenella longinqua]OAM28349.1 GTP cyclohydrolase [Eikenella longinqua]